MARPIFMSSSTRSSTPHDTRPLERGVTLIELAVVLAVIGVLSLVAIPSISSWSTNQRIKATSRESADILRLARAEAIRTGDHQVVLFGPDPDNTPLVDPAGQPAALMALDDGAPTAANCRIDAGEANETVSVVRGVVWGVSFATMPVPTDANGATFAPPQASGNTFRDPNNNPTRWVIFRPDGIPVVATGTSPDCGTIGGMGSGAAAFYLTNGSRDYAVVLSALGTVRVHAWNLGAGQWSS